MTTDHLTRKPVRVRATVAAVLGAGMVSGALLATSAFGADQGQAPGQAPAQSPPASGPAQPEAATPAAPEEVTITGTRIKRKDLEAESPLAIVDSTQLEMKAGLNIESYLNQLPQYNPGLTPTTEVNDVQPSAVNTVGIVTIDPRGLGANRSLVLVDGHRTTPVNAVMVTDINSIPSSMIDHIEIGTGGESAVYGADAMAGVTNFITKKDFQGAQIDVQDSLTQAGDGNELKVSALLGTKFSDGRGSIISGLEYYNRGATYENNRSFYTNAWTDPNAPQVGSNAIFVQGYSGYATLLAAPNAGAVAALFPQRAGASSILSYNPNAPGIFNTYNINPGGSLFTMNGPLATSGYTGPTSSGGYGLVNTFDASQPNVAGSPPPAVDQGLKFNNPLTLLSEPQKRWSFFTNATYDITDKVQFYVNTRFADSLTTTLLGTPTTAIYGWEANIPFNATTDSPINPSVTNQILNMPAAQQQAAFQQLAASFQANPSKTNPNYNPSFKGNGVSGAQHPVPWQLALLLDSRGQNGMPAGAVFGMPATGGAPSCFPQIAASLCDSTAAGTSSWSLSYLPENGALQRTTVDETQSWQAETGLKNIPLMIKDWTAEIYYSHGESLTYEQGLGNDDLQQFRALLQSPGYGQNLTGLNGIVGNQNGANPGFGTAVPATCTSGFYNSIFGGDVAPSADCENAYSTVLQSLTRMVQDDAQVNLSGTLFKLPAGDVSGALGYEFRREQGEFQPDTLQSANSFLNQAIGLYPLGTLQQSTINYNDVYAEMFLPVVSNLGLLHKLDFDLGVRHSDSDITGAATTFKINMDAKLGNSLGVRGGFNRANRAPNLGELFLGEQEYIGAPATFGDPCSVRSTALFGAGGAAPDTSPSAGPTKLAAGQTAAGAKSTYLICQALMQQAGGATAVDQYYNQTSQASLVPSGVGGGLGFLTEEGSPNLHYETADTWTAGFTVSNLSDNPLLRGLTGSIDWWRIDIANAIGVDSADYANYECYGTNIVNSPAAALAQADTQACQNVPRLAGNGGAATELLTYTNLGTIDESGIDFNISWSAELSDLGIRLPGALTFNTQDEKLDFFYTKASPLPFDVRTNWAGSFGPNLPGTDAGSFSYRLTATIGYAHPDFGVNLHWLFYPSTISAGQATQNAIVANNNAVAASGKGTMVGYVPVTDIATKAYSLYNLSGYWQVSKILQIRGGINNVFNTMPPISSTLMGNGPSTGHPPGTDLGAVCNNRAPGCITPPSYSLPNDGAGQTEVGLYDVYGRTFFLGFKATF